ncbi:MAG: hypothetical protein Q8O14_10490 [bacterium]|nr:hypothetical protein [bacterium]
MKAFRPPLPLMEQAGPVLLLLFIALLLVPSARAAEQAAPRTMDEKLDTLLVQQQELLKGQEQLKREILQIDPFPDGAFAIAVNVPLALASTAGDTRMYSGSLIWFPPRSRLEVVMPIWHRSVNDDTDFRATLVDLQLRSYLSRRRSGFYWVAGMRQAWLSGRTSNNPFDWELDDGERLTVDKVGVYGGFGFRARSSRLYWNCNLLLGRYFGGEDVDLRNDGLLGEDYLLDVELFKFGIIF